MDLKRLTKALRACYHITGSQKFKGQVKVGAHGEGQTSVEAIGNACRLQMWVDIPWMLAAAVLVDGSLISQASEIPDLGSSTLVVDGDYLRIRGKDTEASIPLYPIKDFPSVVDQPTQLIGTVDGQQLAELIHRTSWLAGGQAVGIASPLQMVQLESKRGSPGSIVCTACNGTGLASGSIPADILWPITAGLPPEGLAALPNIPGPVQVRGGPQRWEFRAEGWQGQIQLSSVPYPDISQAFRGSGPEASIETEDLAGLLSDSSIVKDPVGGVSISLAMTAVSVTARGPNGSHFNGRAPVGESTGSGTMAVNYQMLRSIVGYLPIGQVTLSILDGLRLRLQSGQYQYVLAAIIGVNT